MSVLSLKTSSSERAFLKETMNVLKNGTEKRRLNGKYHNENGPTIISPSDRREPAVLEPATRSSSDGQEPIHANGIKEWYINGKLHNENGPAVIWTDGEKEWYIKGEKMSKKEFLIYKKLRDKYSLLGVPVRDKWRVREIILSWYDNPRFKCVQKRLERECIKLYK